jgi:hypothetical protein
LTGVAEELTRIHEILTGESGREFTGFAVTLIFMGVGGGAAVARTAKGIETAISRDQSNAPW